MANNVVLNIKVDDDGSLNIVAKEAQAAAAGLDKVEGSTKRASTAKNRYNKLEKGTAQLGANSTKSFAKQAQTIGSGLVPAYATLAANLFALSAAFGALQRAAAMEQLEQGLIRVGQAAGQNLPYVAQQLKEITGNAVSSQQAMESTALAMSAGFSTDQLFELTKVAKGASLALGRDMGDALTRLTRGTAKLEPEILDELGIIVRLDEATRNYALSIDKNVDALTRYERQQAFLNATIEEGRKKFDIVAESVDPNPYDKLLASLSDLSKAGLNLVNNVLEPLVTFLAESPGALVGAMVLFGSTIVKQIIPALDEVVARQRAIATSALSSAKKAAKTISTQYTKASADVKALDFTISPKSVQKMEAAFKAGTVSVKDMQKAVRNLSLSEQMRNKQPKSTKTQEYNDQTAAIVKQRLAIEALIAAEKNKYTVTAKGMAATRNATATGLTARGLSEMERATGLFGQLAVAAKYSGLQMENMGRKGAGLMTTVRGLTGAVQLFGRALLNMIPYIGQVLFILSLFEDQLRAIFGKGEVEKAADEVLDSFKKFPEITKKLTTQLEGLTTAEEKYAAVLKVRAGVADQVIQGINKLKETAQNEAAKELLELTEKIADKEADLAYYLEQRPNQLGDIQRRQDSLNKLKAREAELTGAGTNLTKESVRSLINQTVAYMKVGEGSKHYAVQIEKLEGHLAALEGAGNVTAETLKEITDDVGLERKLHAEVETVTEGFVELNKVVAKSAQKSKGHGSDLLDSLGSIAKSIASAQEIAEANEETALFKVSDQDLFTLFKMNGALGGQSMYWLDIGQRIDQVRDLYQAQLDIIVEQTAESERLANKAKELSAVSKNNETLKKIELDLSKQSMQAELKALEAKQKVILADAMGNKQSEKYKEITQEIGTLKEQIKATDDDHFLVEQAKLNAAKELAGFVNRELAAQKQLLDIRASQARRAKELLRFQQGSALTAEDELALLRERVLAETTKDKDSGQSLRDRQEAAAKERVRIEYDLLELQFKLEKSKINRLLKEKKIGADEAKAAIGIIESAETALGSARTAATNLVTAQFGEKSQADADKDAELVRKVELEKRALMFETLEMQKSIAESIGDSELEHLISMRSARKEEGILRAELEEMAANKEQDTIAFRQKALELAKKEAEVQALILDKKREGARNLGEASGMSGIGVALENAINQEARQENIEALEAEFERVKKKFGEASSEAIAASQALADAQASDTKMRLQEAQAGLSAFAENMKALGPEGEALGSLMSGISNMSVAFTEAFEIIGTKGESMGQKIMAGAGAVLSVITAIGNTQAAASKQRERQIDREIAAEKKRDGKSKESLAKISALEKKKDKEARKAFEAKKKADMAQTIIATATGAMEAYKSMVGIPFVGPALGAAAAAMVVAMGAKQLSTIASSSYDGGGSSASASAATPSKISAGSRSSSIDMAKSRGAAGELSYLRGADGVGGPENFTPAFSGMKYRAEGGNAGMVVGEQGPELFVPSVPGRVVPNDDLGAGGVQNVNFSINAVDASGIEEVLTSQRGNIIGMLREASNSYGEPFMEKVNTDIYTRQGGVSLYGET